MKITQSKFLMLYIVLAILMCVIELRDMATLRYIIKPLLCLSLVGYVCTSYKKYGLRNLLLIQIALIFSFLGDSFLLFPNFFILGLISFLFAHISYIVLFYKDADISNVMLARAIPTLQKSDTKINFILVILGVIVYIGVFYFLIQDKLHDLKIPVLIYMIVISLMFILALLRKVKVGYKVVVVGALFFVISDSTLAINMFVSQFKFASLLIMVTYMLAQYLIVTGCVKKSFRDILSTVII